MTKNILDEYRFFDPDKSVRKIAYELYLCVKNLPIISPHGHVDPKLLAENKPFPDPTELIIIPDHYLFRMLYSQGISLESLGIPSVDGSEVEKDHRKIWQIFADNFYLFNGTPTGIWLQHEFTEVFGIQEKLNSENGLAIYDIIQEKLQSREFLPRALFERFNIEVLSTTDGANDSLEYHKMIKDSGWNRRVLPCLRPDTLVNIISKNWKQDIGLLGSITGIDITSYKTYLQAIKNRREFFKTMGAVSTDHGVTNPYTHSLSESESEAIFQKALKGTASVDDAKMFTANMLMEMARMSIDDGLVMQIHPGVFRSHNLKLFDKFGADKGADIPIQAEYTHNLYELLNEFGNNKDLSIIIFTLDETTYSRELAPLAGHYPALKLGPAWWFNDSIQGMTRFRESVTETAGIYNTVGFNDDTRAFLSIPARHDLSRRVDSNFLAGMVACHIISMDEAVSMGKALAYDLVKKAYKL
jgi:glucuronate isomerase